MGFGLGSWNRKRTVGTNSGNLNKAEILVNDSVTRLEAGGVKRGLETAWTELVWGVIGCFQVSGLCGWGGQE